MFKLKSIYNSLMDVFWRVISWNNNKIPFGGLSQKQGFLSLEVGQALLGHSCPFLYPFRFESEVEGVIDLRQEPLQPDGRVRSPTQIGEVNEAVKKRPVGKEVVITLAFEPAGIEVEAQEIKVQKYFSEKKFEKRSFGDRLIPARDEFLLSP